VEKLVYVKSVIKRICKIEEMLLDLIGDTRWNKGNPLSFMSKEIENTKCE
jgi:hypothetical protein